MNHNCKRCGVPLIIGENITQNGINHSVYICRNCVNAYQRDWVQTHREQRREFHREWKHRTGRQQSMSENRSCGIFLGVYVAERVLSHVFKNVERMPYGNHGFDFICNRGKKIDVKSSCRNNRNHHANSWMFTIRRNRIADYFLCIAFDNRESLNPEHIWLIPAGDINHLRTAAVAETALKKWNQYTLDINKVVKCCDTIREVMTHGR